MAIHVSPALNRKSEIAAAAFAALVRGDEQWRALFVRFSSPEAWAPYLKGLVLLAQTIAAVQARPRAPDYETVLIEVGGYEPDAARWLSLWATSTAEQNARELDRVRRKLGSTLRQLVKAAGRSTLVVSRRAEDLRPLLNDWTRPFVEEALAGSHLRLSFEEFRDMAAKAAKREPAACAHLAEIAPLIFESIPKARGRSLPVETVAHAQLLMAIRGNGHRASFTYSDIEDDHTDKMTAATRRHFQKPRFRPVGARDLLDSRLEPRS